ncbi:MAG: hypothetical protein LIP23_06555, partial [Planctomycetes bacterium]|nr:hypothetical protein [Planctomycetota bacterium]
VEPAGFTDNSGVPKKALMQSKQVRNVQAVALLNKNSCCSEVEHRRDFRAWLFGKKPEIAAVAIGVALLFIESWQTGDRVWKRWIR